MSIQGTQLQRWHFGRVQNDPKTAIPELSQSLGNLDRVLNHVWANRLIVMEKKPANGQVPIWNSATANWEPGASGAGSVTIVAGPTNILDWATATTTPTATTHSTPANFVMAGPVSGGAAAWAPRALVAADIPAIASGSVTESMLAYPFANSLMIMGG